MFLQDYQLQMVQQEIISIKKLGVEGTISKVYKLFSYMSVVIVVVVID